MADAILMVNETDFRSACFHILAALESGTYARIVITRRGRPIAEVAPPSRLTASSWKIGIKTDEPTLTGLDLDVAGAAISPSAAAGKRRRRGLPISPNTMSAGEFKQWRLRSGLSLTSAAEALGISRRQVAHYGAGTKPIPSYIVLACDAIERERRNR